MKNKGIILFGCGGHAKSCIDIAISLKIYNIIVVDENANQDEFIMGYMIYNSIPKFNNQEYGFFTAIGDNSIRSQIYNYYVNKGCTFVNLISSHAYLSSTSEMGNGVFIGHNCHVGPDVIIGNNSIINTHAIIEHDCRIGNNTHIAIGAHVAGRVSIGDFCMVGAGSTIRDRISINNSIIIGAGAVVVNNIEEKGIYVGIPAKIKPLK